ncbi:MAG: LapA family protein [Deltaproteobacteria bacterium]|nr:LapA family protein [Candidatus Anaeroferrophillus wilburensis]MBN2888015.1 LapA family protein [Deltaproteobacteria bacterium]
MKARFYVALVIGLLALLFMVQNARVVEIRFLFWHFSLSRALLLLVTMLAGLVLGVLFGSYRSKDKTSQY